MSNSEWDPTWILSKGQLPEEGEELRAAASRVWPRVQALVRYKLPKNDPDDRRRLGSDAWESVLQSVSKTLQRHSDARSQIVDLDAYLFGAFLHRFNRAMRRERRRQQTLQAVSSMRELEQLPEAQDWKSARDMERSLEVQQVTEKMDGWTRGVYAARMNGYAWREIAELYGLNENQAKLRFGRALRKLAARLGHRK